MGEEVYFGHRLSKTGGRISRDFTDGYGPEVYMNADAPAGEYVIRAKYYSSHQVSAATGATCAVLWHVTGLGDFSREKLAVSMVRMNRYKQQQEVSRAQVPDVAVEASVPTFFTDDFFA